MSFCSLLVICGLSFANDDEPEATEECFATIKIPNRGLSHSSWYAMWEAVSAIYWRCMRGSVPLAGRASGVGSPGRIEVTLSDRSEQR